MTPVLDRNRQKKRIGIEIVEAVYCDHALDLRVTCMFLCCASCSLRSQLRRYSGSTYCFGDALDIWKNNCRKKGQDCCLLGMYERVKTLRFLVFWIVSSRKLWVYIYNTSFTKNTIVSFHSRQRFNGQHDLNIKNCWFKGGVKLRKLKFPAIIWRRGHSAEIKVQ